MELVHVAQSEMISQTKNIEETQLAQETATADLLSVEKEGEIE